MQVWIDEWVHMNPDWVVCMWTDDIGSRKVSSSVFIPSHIQSSLPAVFHSNHVDLLEKACHLSQRSNIWRYEIINQFGGLYLDTDMQPFKPLGDVFRENDSVAVATNAHNPQLFECGLFASTPHHPFTEDLSLSLSDYDPAVSSSMGPSYFTKVVARHPEVVRLDTELFLFEYPNPWHIARSGEVGKDRPRSDKTIAIHRCSSLWHPTGFKSLVSPIGH
jgi:mannosyltransferase OCH1-like enzyme